MNLSELKAMSTKEWVKNIILYAIGVGIMPLGVVLTVNAHLGAGGYDALNFTIAHKLNINTSWVIYSTAFLILLLAAVIRRSYPRIETFISSFFLGIFTDVWNSLLAPIQGTNFINSLVIMSVGILVVAFAVACYIISVFPTNPTDDLVVALNERGMSLGKAKILLDGVCVVVAFILGGEIGIGTLICTFGLGPIIDFFHKCIERTINK